MNAYSEVRPDAAALPEDLLAGTFARRVRMGALASLWAALTFNLALAFVNAQVMAISGGIVTAVQGAVMASALATGLLLRREGWRRWAAMLVVVTILWLLLSVLRQALEVKFLGDAMLIPAYALAGTCLSRRGLLRWFLAAQLVITVVGAWELIHPQSYAGTFNVSAYYVNTRGIDADSFWSEAGEGLFLNVERPTGRNLLPQTGWNRATSVFLEPVSLGNWTVVVLIVLIAMWGRMGWGVRAALVASDLFLVVACDGRFALICGAGVLLTVPFGRWAPRLWPLVYLPAMVVALFGLRALDQLPRGGDTFAGRLRKGIDYLERLRLEDVLGMGTGDAVSASADSGWAYLIQSQSLVGLIGLWALVVLMARTQDAETRSFVNATSIYFTLCMPISNSFVSIKTVAPIFALYGCLVAATAVARGPIGLMGLPRRVPPTPIGGSASAVGAG